MPPTVVIAAANTLATTAADLIANGIQQTIDQRGACTVALCGGTTPEPVYRLLAAAPLSWPKISIYFGDERAVPLDDSRSNFLMVRRALLDRVDIPLHQIHRMHADAPDVEVAATAYGRVLPAALDLLLLGIGSDGHTASIFPNSDAVREGKRRVMMVPIPPGNMQPAVPRMTITPPVIAAARAVVVMVSGAGKATIVQQILEGPEQTTALPAQLARNGIWILDQDSAGLLQQRTS